MPTFQKHQAEFKVASGAKTYQSGRSGEFAEGQVRGREGRKNINWWVPPLGANTKADSDWSHLLTMSRNQVAELSQL